MKKALHGCEKGSTLTHDPPSISVAVFSAALCALLLAGCDSVTDLTCEVDDAGVAIKGTFVDTVSARKRRTYTVVCVAYGPGLEQLCVDKKSVAAGGSSESNGTEHPFSCSCSLPPGDFQPEDIECQAYIE